jgi:hypothetical protein
MRGAADMRPAGIESKAEIAGSAGSGDCPTESQTRAEPVRMSVRN